ncbi:MAG TPA: transposase, partial [Acidimicrobiales bacterium]
LVQSMGIDGISKSQVSEMARSLDAQVEAFRSRPLDAGPYTYVAVDALTQRVREGGRIVNVACAIAPASTPTGTLWQIVFVRMHCDPGTREYVERRTKEGLSRKEIMRCLKRYVAREVYQCLPAITGIKPGP